MAVMIRRRRTSPTPVLGPVPSVGPANPKGRYTGPITGVTGVFRGATPSLPPQASPRARQALAARGARVGGPRFGSRVLASYKKGGKVPKTGAYKLHKGETVMPAKKRKRKGDVQGYMAMR